MHSQDRNKFYRQVKGKSQSKTPTTLETALRTGSHFLVLNTFNSCCHHSNVKSHPSNEVRSFYEMLEFKKLFSDNKRFRMEIKEVHILV